MGTDLKLQNGGLAGNLDIFNGKVVITNSGDLLVMGTVTADKVKAHDLSVGKITVLNDPVLSASASSAPQNKDTSVGVSVIPAGTLTIVVDNSRLTEKSLIFTTPDQPVAVGTKKDTTSFEISIKEPLSSDLKINYWIIN